MLKWLIFLGFVLMVALPSTSGEDSDPAPTSAPVVDDFQAEKAKWETMKTKVNVLKENETCTEEHEKKFADAEAKIVEYENAKNSTTKPPLPPIAKITSAVNAVTDDMKVCTWPNLTCESKMCVLNNDPNKCGEVEGGDYSKFRPGCFKDAVTKWPENSAVTLRSRIIPVMLATFTPALIFTFKVFL